MTSSPDDIYSLRRAELVRLLRAEGILDPRVLEALAKVPRHLFVPEELRDRAYENRALPIGEGQTISQPLIVGMMTEALELKGDEKVLEVGTGSGYQAAVLAELAREVHTLERSRRLHDEAKQRLEDLGYTNVICHLRDGSAGLPEEAPFDAICVTAAAPRLPEPLLEQLKEGGRLVIPVGDVTSQVLRLVTKTPGGYESVDLSPVMFVPLIGAHGWSVELRREDGSGQERSST